MQWKNWQETGINPREGQIEITKTVIHPFAWKFLIVSVGWRGKNWRLEGPVDLMRAETRRKKNVQLY